MDELYYNYNISSNIWADTSNMINKYCNIAVNGLNAAQKDDVCILQGKIDALETEIKELKNLLRSTTTLVLTLAGNEKIKELNKLIENE